MVFKIEKKPSSTIQFNGLSICIKYVDHCINQNKMCILFMCVFFCCCEQYSNIQRRKIQTIKMYAEMLADK